MSRFASVFCIAAASAVAAAPALAGPLEKSRIPADVQWLVHVDVEAGLSSTLGQYLLAHRDELEGLDKVKAETGIDPFTDIKGITVFGAGPDPRDGLAIIESTAAADRLVERARDKEASFKEITDGKYHLYTWTEHDEPRFAQLRPGANADDRLVVVSADKDRLISGLRVLDGQTANLSSVDSGVLSEKPKSGSVLFAAATNLSEAQAVILQRADSVLLDLGESEHQVFADMTVVPKNQSDAKNLMQTMQGALALASMCMQGQADCAQMTKVLQGISFSSKDGRVTAHVRLSADLVLSAAGELKSMRDKDEKNEPRTKSAAHSRRKAADDQPAKNPPNDGSPDH